MKSAIFAVLVFLTSFTPAEAIEVGRIGNEGGGAIVFTSEVCKADASKYLFYGYVIGGEVATGCWVIINTEIFAKWSDGEIRVYPTSAMKLSDEFRRAYSEYSNRKEM